MNPFVSRITNNNGWVVPVSGLCLVLGFMIAMAWVTDQTRSSRISLLGADQQSRVMSGTVDVQEGYRKLSDEVAKLRKEKTQLENQLGSQTSGTKLLNDSLQEAKEFAGLTKMEGPGVKITLQDSHKQVPGMATDQILHDADILRVVNELWNAGADALSINNRRVGPRSNYRCVGSVIEVDTVPVSSPIYIRAIGDSQTLLGALNMPLGVLSELKSVDPAMVQVEAVKEMQMPDYAGSTASRVAKVPKEHLK